MRAVRAHDLSGPSGLRVDEVPDPTVPDGWVEIEVRAASLNHHDVWSLRGVGQSPASRWWACAGYVAGRTWQPLILDDRVYATLNRTLMIGGTTRLASSRRRADRYRAYVEAIHRWAVELRLEGRDADAERIAFVLGRHDGGASPTP